MFVRLVWDKGEFGTKLASFGDKMIIVKKFDCPFGEDYEVNECRIWVD